MSKMKGFSIVELLVAILILTIGLIGLAGLQSAGLRTNQGAYLRSVAVELAYDMADRIRANPLGVQNYLYNKGGENKEVQCDKGPCSAGDLAGYDLAKWNAQLKARLPSGSGIVCLVSNAEVALIGDSTKPDVGCVGNAPNTPYAIKIWWNDDRSNNPKQGFVMTFQP